MFCFLVRVCVSTVQGVAKRIIKIITAAKCEWNEVTHQSGVGSELG